MRIFVVICIIMFLSVQAITKLSDEEIEQMVEDAKSQPIVINGNHKYCTILLKDDNELYNVISDSAFDTIQSTTEKDSEWVAKKYNIDKKKKLLKKVKIKKKK